MAGKGSVSSHVLNVLIGEAATESRHGVLAVGDLGDDGLDADAAVKVLLERLKLNARGGGDRGGAGLSSALGWHSNQETSRCPYRRFAPLKGQSDERL